MTAVTGPGALDLWEEEQTPRHPFSTSLWLGTWWEAFGTGAELPVVPVTDERGTTIAVLPVHRDREHTHGVSLSRLQSPWNSHTPRTSLLVGEESERTCRLLWRHLRDEHGRWDVLRFCQLADDEADTPQRIARMASDDGFLVGWWPSCHSPFVPMRESWDDYLASLSSKFRSNLRRRRRLLEEVGSVDFESIGADATGEEIDDALVDTIRLESSGWKAEQGTAIENDEPRMLFYRLLAHRAAAAGWLRLRFLRVDGRRIAVNFSLLHRNRLYFLKGGYDPDFGRCSPSNLLLEEVLRNAHEAGLDEVDLLGDAERWKERWTEHRRAHQWLFVYRPSLKTRLVHGLKFGVAPRVRDAIATGSAEPSFASNAVACQ